MRRPTVIGALGVAVTTLAAGLSVSITATPVASAAGADRAHHDKVAQPDIAALAGPLAHQQLDWTKPCEFGSPETNAEYARPTMTCALVQVPRNWRTPGDGRTFSLQVVQIHNVDTDDPDYKGTIIANPGGPGVAGSYVAPIIDTRAARLRKGFNIIGFDPRGTDGFNPLLCLVERPAADDPDPYAQQKAIGRTCSTDPDVSTISTEQAAYDMELIRHLMGVKRIDYLGYSYGTWLGSWYAKLFPRSVRRMVQDSSIDTTQATLESAYPLQSKARDRQFRLHLLPWIARQNATYGLGSDPEAIYRRYFEASAKIDRYSIYYSWAFTGATDAFPRNVNYPLAATIVAGVIATGDDPSIPLPGNPPAEGAAAIVAAAASQPGASEPGVRASLTKASQALEELADVPPIDFEKYFPYWNPLDYYRCNDGQWTQGETYWEAANAREAAENPLTAQLGVISLPICAFWPTTNSMPKAPQRGFPDALVIQTELDSQTAYEGGYRTATLQPNTRGIVIDNEGDHAVFPYGTACVDEPVYRFLETGRRPGHEITKCQARPLPKETTTYESWTPLTRDGRITRQVVSPSIPAPADEPRGPRRSHRDEEWAGRISGAESAVERITFEQQIRRTYGERGVRAFRAAD